MTARDRLASGPARRRAPDRFRPRAGLRGWVVLGMLTFVYVLNFLDRQLLAILAKPIQDALHITDGQLGLIGGLYFALFYCFIAIPVGWLADRTNRVTVLSLACAIWSAATAACGLAATYPQLVVGAHDGRLRRGGRRAAVLRDHHRHLPAGQARHGVRRSTISARRSARRWASRSAPRSRRRSTGATPSSRSASIGIVAAVVVRLIVREPARGGLDPAATRRAAEGKAPFWGTVQDVLRPTRC